MLKAYFAGGCFWCISSYFNQREGINKVVSGYSGGSKVNPTYEEVKSQVTGHRETIEINYNEKLVSYNKLLDIFFDSIDPFDKEGQYIDKGLSYTTAIFYQNEEEKRLALEKIESVSKKSGKEVFVKVLPFKSFYKAEEYHQDFSIKHKEEFIKEMKESGRIK